MEFTITLEPKPSIISNKEELLIEELEKKSKVAAVQKSGRVPSIEEVLYNMDEEEMLDIQELTGATD